MARFSSGPDHTRRRALVLGLLSRIDPERAAKLARERTETIVAVADRIDVMAAVARPVPVGVLDTLLGEAGPDDDPEVQANREGILLQARDATAGLIGNSLLAEADPYPVRNTRRVRDGGEIVLDLTGLPFGAGTHACPGEALALAIADAVVGVLRQGRLITTEVEYEHWPNMRIPARLEMSFTLASLPSPS